MSNTAQYGSRTRARSHRPPSGLPKPPRRQGYRWWVYVILVVVAIAAVALAYIALTADNDVATAAGLLG